MSGLDLASKVRTRLDVLSFCAEVRRAAGKSGLDPRESGELSLVVAELATNAVLHGGGGAVTVNINPSGWTVSVRDVGPGFSRAVLADAGRSDRLGAHGVREPGDGRRSFGSGLAAARRLSTSLTLNNEGTGAHALAAKHLSKSQGVSS